jgi:hypothetical protein
MERYIPLKHPHHLQVTQCHKQEHHTMIIHCCETSAALISVFLKWLLEKIVTAITYSLLYLAVRPTCKKFNPKCVQIQTKCRENMATLASKMASVENAPSSSSRYSGINHDEGNESRCQSRCKVMELLEVLKSEIQSAQLIN